MVKQKLSLANFWITVKKDEFQNKARSAQTATVALFRTSGAVSRVMALTDETPTPDADSAPLNQQRVIDKLLVLDLINSPGSRE